MQGHRKRRGEGAHVGAPSNPIHGTPVFPDSSNYRNAQVASGSVPSVVPINRLSIAHLLAVSTLFTARSTRRIP